MHIRIGINLLPRFMRGEKVLYLKSWIWAASVKTLPTYRWFFSLPPFWEVGVYVTDKAIIFSTYLFRLLAFDYRLWFEADGSREQVKSVEVKDIPILGRCVEIVSEDPTKHWYRSRTLRTRVFMRDPEALCELIAGMITK